MLPIMVSDMTLLTYTAPPKKTNIKKSRTKKNLKKIISMLFTKSANMPIHFHLEPNHTPHVKLSFTVKL